MIFYNIMNIDFQCECGQQLSALGHQVGELIDCPVCNQLVQVPPRPGVKQEPEEEPQGSVERRDVPRLSRAPACKRCKSRLVPSQTKEDSPVGNILGRSIFVVGLVVTLSWFFGSGFFMLLLGLLLMIGGVAVIVGLRETKMTMACPKCHPVLKTKNMLGAR